MSVVLSSDKLRVKILSKGAEVCSVKNKKGLEFIWQADENVWPRHAPVLFPIVGKLKENTFFYGTTPYSLGQHGFARDRDFILTKSDDASCTFELHSDSGTKSDFPFDFNFQISYRIDDKKLITKYDISNPADLPLYFSVGAHPGFRCPLEEHETFEDYYLEFDSDKFDLSSLIEGLRDKTKKTISLENKRIPLTTELFDNDALVFENKQIDSVSLRSSKSSHKITMQCHDWPYFGIWTKKSCRDFICLEPWYGIADRIDSSQELSEKDGIIRLEPKKSFSCTFDLDFE